MELRVVDFDVLTRNYKNYQIGLKNIEGEKNGFLTKLGPIKQEMENIIEMANNGSITDPSMLSIKEKRFQEIQEEAVRIDTEFKASMRRMHDELNKTTFDELSVIINDWSISNNIDLVIGKMEVVFLTSKYEATDYIIELLKKNDLFVESVEEVTI